MRKNMVTSTGWDARRLSVLLPRPFGRRVSPKNNPLGGCSSSPSRQKPAGFGHKNHEEEHTSSLENKTMNQTPMTQTTTEKTAPVDTATMLNMVAQDPVAMKILEGTVTRIVDARLEDEKWRRRFGLIATFGVAYITGVFIENRRPKTAKERVRILFTGK